MKNWQIIVFAALTISAVIYLS